MKKNEELMQIEGTEEAWDSRLLGADAEYAQANTDISIDQALNDSLGMQMISIRFQKKLLEEIKMIAEINNVGYQPLIKQVMQRFVDAEMKNLLRERASIARKQKSDDDVLAEDFDEPLAAKCG